MRFIATLLLAVLCLGAYAQTNYPVIVIPSISLFDSAASVKAYLSTNAILDYSDSFPLKVDLQCLEGYQRKGPAWVYTYSFKKPQPGRIIRVVHYMDGEIVELDHDPLTAEQGGPGYSAQSALSPDP